MATQLMIFYFVIFSPMGVKNAVLVAIVSFGINSGAYCTEIFRAGIQGVDAGQMEAGRSLGLNWSQTMVKIIMPQALIDSVILHEMAHYKYKHHRKSFWNFLSQLLGEDAQTQKGAMDIVLSKYWIQIKFLMK